VRVVESVEFPEGGLGLALRPRAREEGATDGLGTPAPAANQRPVRSLTVRECSNVSLETVFGLLPRFTCAAPTQRSTASPVQSQILVVDSRRAPITTALPPLDSRGRTCDPPNPKSRQLSVRVSLTVTTPLDPSPTCLTSSPGMLWLSWKCKSHLD
jgi:hypothetical protein